jgi:hypothetical protein
LGSGRLSRLQRSLLGNSVSNRRGMPPPYKLRNRLNLFLGDVDHQQNLAISDVLLICL